MLPFKTLWKGKFIGIISPEEHPYECVNEGESAFVLPFIKQNGKILVGIRKEYCPPYFCKDDKVKLYYTVVSGTRDKGETLKDTALRELREEAGIIPKKYTINPLFGHEMPVYKGSNYRTQIFVIVIDDYDLEPPTGDGTINEKLSKTIWIDKENFDNIFKGDSFDFLLFGLSNTIKTRLK